MSIWTSIVNAVPALQISGGPSSTWSKYRNHSNRWAARQDFSLFANDRGHIVKLLIYWSEAIKWHFSRTVRYTCPNGINSCIRRIFASIEMWPYCVFRRPKRPITMPSIHSLRQRKLQKYVNAVAVKPSTSIRPTHAKSFSRATKHCNDDFWQMLRSLISFTVFPIVKLVHTSPLPQRSNNRISNWVPAVWHWIRADNSSGMNIVWSTR